MWVGGFPGRKISLLQMRTVAPLGFIFCPGAGTWNSHKHMENLWVAEAPAWPPLSRCLGGRSGLSRPLCKV